MKFLKALTLIVGTIALFPTASFADNVSVNTQEVNQSSIIVGNGNLVKSDVRQSIINLQKPERQGTNVESNTQKINSKSIIVGDRNVDIKTAIQSTLDLQHHK